MKKSLPHRALIALVVGSSLFSAWNAHSQVITNSGFELGSSSPTGWGTVVSGSAVATWVSGEAGDAVYQGTRAVSITNPDKGTFANRWNLLSANRISLTEGQSFNIALYAKGTNLDLVGGINEQDGFAIGLIYYNASNTQVGTWQSSAVSFTTNNTWTQFSFDTAAAPTGATTAVLQLVYRRPLTVTSGADASITWDSLSLTAVPEPGSVALFGLGMVILGYRSRKVLGRLASKI